MPGRLSFHTTADGAHTPTERMRIDSAGRVGIGKTPESAVGSVLQTKGNDGISFQRPGESLSTILRPLSSGLGLRLNYQDGDEILRVDNNGRLLLGTADDGFAGGLTTMVIGNASATNSGVTIASSPSNGTGRIHFADANSGTATYAGYIAYVHSSNSLSFGSGGNGTQALVLDSSQNATFAGTVSDSKGNLRSIPQNQENTHYTLVASDAGKHVLLNGGTSNVTVANNFAIGDAITIINRTGANSNILESSVTLVNAADGTTGTRVLANHGMVTILFITTGIAYISGAGLS